jgi:RNA polymerase sigma-70 factor (ECF subfamily)
VDVTGAAIETEHALVAALKAGDPKAFETLVRSQTARMLNVARRILGDEHDARDAVQDAFLSAFRAIERFDGRSQLSTWLHRVVTNAALMKLRTRKRRPERSIDDLLPRFHDDGHRVEPRPAWTTSCEELLSRRETRDQIHRLIAELPEDYRTVLVLRDIEQLSTAETGRQLEISPGAVKTRLHRARQALRTLLETEIDP